MTWLNEPEIEDTVRRHPVDERPNLAAGATTLHNLMVWVNHNSDGWPYWNPPAKAATKLMDLLQAHNPWQRANDDDCTLADLNAAYRPIKSFRTKRNNDKPGSCDFKIVDPAAAAAQRIEDAKDAVGTHVRYTIILERPIDHEDERHSDGFGVAAAQRLTRALAECGLPGGGDFVVAGRRSEGRSRLPLAELAPDVEINRPNFQDDPT